MAANGISAFAGLKTFVRNTWVGGNTSRKGFRLKPLSKDFTLQPLSPGTSMFTASFQPMAAVHNGTQYVVVGNGGLTTSALVATAFCYTSPDGEVWTQRSIQAGVWTSIVWTGALFIAFGRAGVCSTSPDGITWTAQAAIVAAVYLGVYGTTPALALAFSAGVSSAYYSSPTGAAWTTRALPVAIIVTGSLWANGMFVVVGYTTNGAQGYVLTSTDGINWTQRTVKLAATGTALTGAINYAFAPVSVAWDGTVFCVAAVGKMGSGSSGATPAGGRPEFYTSTDGVTWLYSGSIPVSIPFAQSSTTNPADAFGSNTLYAPFEATHPSNIMAGNAAQGRLAIQLGISAQFTDNAVTSYAYGTLLASSNDRGITWSLSDQHAMIGPAASGMRMSAQVIACPAGFLGFNFTASGADTTTQQYWLMTNPLAKELAYAL